MQSTERLHRKYDFWKFQVKLNESASQGSREESWGILNDSEGSKDTYVSKHRELFLAHQVWHSRAFGQLFCHYGSIECRISSDSEKLIIKWDYFKKRDLHIIESRKQFLEEFQLSNCFHRRALEKRQQGSIPSRDAFKEETEQEEETEGEEAESSEATVDAYASSHEERGNRHALHH